MTTTDLSKFGNRELEMLRDILDSMIKDGLPEDFNNDEVQPIFNQNSGYVFLTNSDNQVSMINSDTGKLESWYSSPYEGKEGFFNELLEQYEGMYSDDQEWFKTAPNFESYYMYRGLFRDENDKEKIFQNIFEAFSDKAIICSLHGLHLLPLFDRVYLFEDGKCLRKFVASVFKIYFCNKLIISRFSVFRNFYLEIFALNKIRIKAQ